MEHPISSNSSQKVAGIHLSQIKAFLITNALNFAKWMLPTCSEGVKHEYKQLIRYQGLATK